MEQKPIIDFEDAKKLFEREENPELRETHNIEAQKPPTINYPQHEENKHEEIKAVEHNEEKKFNWLGVLFWIGVVVLAFLVGFAIVNGPAIGKKISFWFDSIRGKTPNANQILKPEVKVSSETSQSTDSNLPDNHLIIPKISVDAPIIWNVDDADVQSKLLEGIVHYKKTATPDQDGGNVFMTGHSSNYWWIKSSYNQVFALLPNLENGDDIVVTYKNIKYVYRVYDKFVVSPDQVDVMNSVDNKSTLTLMSCVPIGTNLKRLIVRAELLYKDEGKGTVETSTSESPETQPQTTTSGGAEKPVEVNNQNTTTTPNASQDILLPSTP